MTLENVAAAKAIAEPTERRSQIAAKLADAEVRLKLQRRLRQALKTLEREGSHSLHGAKLLSVQQKIAAEFGLPVFEVRTFNFEGPLKDGTWLRRTKYRVKEMPWKLWSCGIPEPDVPVVWVMDAIEGTSAMNQMCDVQDAEQLTTVLKNCVQDWLDEIEHAAALSTIKGADKQGDKWSKWLPQEVWRAELQKTYKQLSERTFRNMRNGKHASICIRCHPDSKNSNLSMHLDDLRKLGYEGD